MIPVAGGTATLGTPLVDLVAAHGDTVQVGTRDGRRTALPDRDRVGGRVGCELFRPARPAVPGELTEMMFAGGGGAVGARAHTVKTVKTVRRSYTSARPVRWIGVWGLLVAARWLVSNGACGLVGLMCPDDSGQLVVGFYAAGCRCMDSLWTSCGVR
jgi:hypothetical protein